jgi:hypothetical protein
MPSPSLGLVFFATLDEKKRNVDTLRGYHDEAWTRE